MCSRHPATVQTTRIHEKRLTPSELRRSTVIEKGLNVYWNETKYTGMKKGVTTGKMG
jgi:hypothetical protein